MGINAINVNCTFKIEKRSQKVKGAKNIMEDSVPNMAPFNMRTK